MENYQVDLILNQYQQTLDYFKKWINHSDTANVIDQTANNLNIKIEIKQEDSLPEYIAISALGNSLEIRFSMDLNKNQGSLDVLHISQQKNKLPEKLFSVNFDRLANITRNQEVSIRADSLSPVFLNELVYLSIDKLIAKLKA